VITYSCFISRQLIYNLPEQMFTERKVMAIEHADFEGVERLALCLGAEIASTFDHPEMVKIGHCKLIEEVVIGEDKVIRFTGCERGEACTIILRGASKHILDEAERSLHDALCVLVGATKNPQIIYGGGAAEMLMATAVDEAAKLTAGKERYAMEAFSNALRALPTIIADNGGYDSADLIAQLSALHAAGKKTMGLNMDLGIVGDMTELKITESLKSKMQVLISAHEAAEMILRVDVILKCAPRYFIFISSFFFLSIPIVTSFIVVM
jgi:T-complex protein 1 subunit beta